MGGIDEFEYTYIKEYLNRKWEKRLSMNWRIVGGLLSWLSIGFNQPFYGLLSFLSSQPLNNNNNITHKSTQLLNIQLNFVLYIYLEILDMKDTKLKIQG